MSAHETPPSAKKATAPIAHYRPERYIVAPFEILTDPQLTDGDRRMLLALCSFAIGKSTLWPSRESLAERADIDISNVSKRVRRLVDLGWVTVQQRGHRSNKYHLHLPERLATGDAPLTAEEDVAPCTDPADLVNAVPVETCDIEIYDASEYEQDDIYA